MNNSDALQQKFASLQLRTQQLAREYDQFFTEMQQKLKVKEEEWKRERRVDSYSDDVSLSDDDFEVVNVSFFERSCK